MTGRGEYLCVVVVVVPFGANGGYCQMGTASSKYVEIRTTSPTIFICIVVNVNGHLSVVNFAMCTDLSGGR